MDNVYLFERFIEMVREAS